MLKKKRIYDPTVNLLISFVNQISDALSALAEMEEQLFQVLETLLPYTGKESWYE